MLLTITTTHQPATDLGFLLSKHPDRLQSFSLAHGKAHVFYPEASEERCTAALLLDVDPIGLVRGKTNRFKEGSTLAQYVNDRPYVASSFLSVAIARVLSSAMKGDSTHRGDLAESSLPLEATISTVPCRGGERFLRALFEPLGYEVEAERHPLDEEFPQWGESPYFRVTLRSECRLRDLLTHLYVLLPVLDDEKHYWVGRDELEKLLAKGEGWLESHPAREQIVERYLKHRRSLAREAMSRLIAEEEPNLEKEDERKSAEEEALERPLTLNDQRMGTVLAALRDAGSRSVIDLGCGEGKLLRALLKDRTFSQIAGMDVSHRALEMASKRLRLDEGGQRVADRLTLFQGALTYRDERFSGYDAACVIEVIEHLDPSRLRAFERVLFHHARPRVVLVTTPNIEYNCLFENLPQGRLRHRDHRFEWTRGEFHSWCDRVAEEFGYSIKVLPIGEAHPDHGSPTQMGVFVQ